MKGYKPTRQDLMERNRKKGYAKAPAADPFDGRQRIDGSVDEQIEGGN